jgi:hypothetical protein
MELLSRREAKAAGWVKRWQARRRGSLPGVPEGDAEVKQKPPMPAERPTITIGPMTAKLDNDNERYSSGFVRMTFQDTTADVSQDGKKLGFVTGPMGSGIQVSIGDRQWFISPQEIWRAVTAADAEQYHPKIGPRTSTRGSDRTSTRSRKLR